MPNQVDNLLLDDDTTGLPRTINTASDDIVLSVDLTLQSGGVLTADNIKRGTADPNASGGTPGNEGDIYQRLLAGTGELYVNTDGTATGWSQVLVGASAFVRRDGTTPLTGNWDVGNFDITNIEDLGADTLAITGDGTFGSTAIASFAGAPIASSANRQVQIATTSATNTIAHKLYVNDGSRNTRVQFYLVDAAGGAGGWGHMMTFGSGGSQPYSIYNVTDEQLRLVTGNASTSRIRGGLASTTTGAGGSLEVLGGAGGSVSGNAGSITIQGGTPVDGIGGTINITGSAGVGTNRSGGSVLITSGAATGAGTAGELDLTSAGLMDVNAGANLDIDVTGTFDMLSTTTFSIDGTGASNISATSGNLTVSTITSGTLLLTSAGLIDMDAAANIDIDVTGTFDVLATGLFSIDGAGSSNVSVTGNQLQLSTITSGELDITSAGLLDINAAANIDIDVTGNFDMLATTTFSIDGTGASNISATSGNLTVSTITSGTLLLTSAGLVDMDAAANIDIDVTGSFDVLATGVFSIDGTGASNVSATSGVLTISTITSGNLALTGADAVVITAGNEGAATGNLVSATGGSGGGNNPGGAVTLQGGAGGAGGTGGVGGGITITAGAGGLTGAGGAVVIDAGAGGATSGAGGALTLRAGLPATLGAGGTVTIAARAGVGTNQAGGDVHINAGASTGNADAGDLNFTAGTGGTTSLGGDVNIFGGSGGSASGTGGAAQLVGGTGTAGAGGSATVLGGTAGSGQGGLAGVFGGASTGANPGGEIYILGGAAGPTGIGGVVTIEGGPGGATSGNGGNVLLVGGAETTGSIGVVRITNTALEFIESATVPGPTIAATQGRFWVRNDVPNVPMFTDDAGTDHNLLDGGSTPTSGDWKESVRVATTGSIALTGEQTIDGIAVVDGDRVLVKNQDATIATAMVTGSSELSTDSGSFVDANCSSPTLDAGTWFAIGFANHRNDDASSSGFGSEVEARIGSTRFAVSSWNSINGQFNIGDDAAGGCLSVFARVTSSGSDTLNMRGRALENAGGEDILVGSQAWIYFNIGTMTENTDYWAAEAANSDTAEVTPNGNTWTASEQLSFTPTETGSYLIMASAEGFNAGGVSISNEYWARLRMDSTTIGTGTEMKCDIANFGTTTAVFGPSFTMIDVRTLTASVPVTFNWEFQNASGFSDLSYRRSRIYVFRLAAFVDSDFAVIADGIQASNSTVECTTALTFDFGASPVTALVLAGCDYANGGAWGSGWLRRDGTPDVDYPPDGRMWAVVETGLGATNDFMPLNFGAVQTSTTNSQTYRLVGMSEDTPTLTFGRTRGNAGNSRMVLVALRMEGSASASQNGIYTCSTGAWSRSTDANTSAEVTSMLTVGVEEGTVNGNSFWYLATMNPITLGSTALVFAELGGAPPGSGLTQPEVLARVSLGF
jgi:hypothetical protein